MTLKGILLLVQSQNKEIALHGNKEVLLIKYCVKDTTCMRPGHFGMSNYPNNPNKAIEIIITCVHCQFVKLSLNSHVFL